MCGNHHSNKGGMTTVINQILEKDWEKEQIQMKFIPTYYRGGKVLTIAFFVLGYVRVFFALFVYKPNVFYTHMSVRGSFARTKALQKLCRRYRTPMVVHLHGSEFEDWYKSESTWKKKEISDFILKCDAFIVLGKKWERFVKSISPSANIKQIHNCISIPVSTVYRNDNEMRFLFLGVLIPRKGVMDLLKAIKQLDDQHAIDQCVFDIGGTGPDEELLKKYVIENSLSSKVNFLGWIAGDRKNKTISQSQVFILPSYNEGLPVAILEAMSYGLPIICTHVGDVAEAVREDVNGYLIEPGDIDGLVNAIIKITDKDTWNRLSQKSKEIILNEFDIHHFYSELISVWKSVCK